MHAHMGSNRFLPWTHSCAASQERHPQRPAARWGNEATLNSVVEGSGAASQGFASSPPTFPLVGLPEWRFKGRHQTLLTQRLFSVSFGAVAVDSIGVGTDLLRFQRA